MERHLIPARIYALTAGIFIAVSAWAVVLHANLGPEAPIHFTDSRLKVAVENQLGISDPTATDMQSLTVLSAWGRGIVDLTGLEYASSLQRLDLDWNRITNLSPIARLKNLTHLYLEGNEISDVSALVELMNLQELGLRWNPLDCNDYCNSIMIIQINNLKADLLYDPDLYRCVCSGTGIGVRKIPVQIYCNTCCDFDGSGVVDMTDYHLLLAEFGLSNPINGWRGLLRKECLDIVIDGCVTIDDLLAWDVIGSLLPKNVCPWVLVGNEPGEPVMVEAQGSAPGFRAYDADKSSPLCLFGKPTTGRDSHLLGIDPNGPYVQDILDTFTEPRGRLIVDCQGNVYQITGDGSLVGRNGLIVKHKKDIIYEDDGSVVSVGFHGGEGVFLLDAVFHPHDPNIVYVVSVIVDPYDGNCPYMAAAKLQLKDEGDWDLLKLYGENPAEESTHIALVEENFRTFVYRPDVYHLCEIEIDSTGENLFVLSRCWYKKNNWVLIYDEQAGNISQVRAWLSDPDDSCPDIDGSTAMVVSSYGEKLYLASSVDEPGEPNDLLTKVYSFSIEKDGVSQKVKELKYDGFVEISCPFPDICSINPSLCDQNLGYISTITSMAEDPRYGTLYVTGFTAPKFPARAEWYDLPEISRIFTTPMLAVVPAGMRESVPAKVIEGADLALPLSLIWVSPGCAEADLSVDDMID